MSQSTVQEIFLRNTQDIDSISIDLYKNVVQVDNKLGKVRRLEILGKNIRSYEKSEKPDYWHLLKEYDGKNFLKMSIDSVEKLSDGSITNLRIEELYSGLNPKMRKVIEDVLPREGFTPATIDYYGILLPSNKLTIKA